MASNLNPAVALLSRAVSEELRHVSVACVRFPDVVAFWPRSDVVALV